eukprot:TRINITY_DN19103_c1_g1_i1.p1 TRINITY_DN19103_c1_g1~~TRINITY_DN19103_c1_g1_i1.p1  ORF type:complete len:296 (+),score=53.34 TRINITY_DN19103_c1_g1_i1:87-974(+)
MSSSTVQTKDDVDFGAIAVNYATGAVKRNPIKVSMWIVGLLVAAFAKGFSVDKEAFVAYSVSLQQAEDVTGTELRNAMARVQQADQLYYNAKGWFWSCDKACMRAWDRLNIAKAEMNRVAEKRDGLVTEARREVGIWSTFGVQDVRDSFWAAWKSGKDFAARYTMMDAMFMMIGGKEETAVSMLVKLLFQYIINLTMGLIGAFFFFIYNVYTLIVSYGEPFMSGLSFFLLVLVAGMSVIGTYLFAIYGTVVGGGAYLVKKAVEQQRLEGERGQQPRRVQYGRPGGMRQGYGMHTD